MFLNLFTLMITDLFRGLPHPQDAKRFITVKKKAC